MNIFQIIILLFVLPLINIAQEIKIVKKQTLLIQTGVSYKTFLSKKYIEATQKKQGDVLLDHQYERFNKIPTMGFSLGWLYNFKISNRTGITTGLVYYLRKDKFETNQDTIIKYAASPTIINNHCCPVNRNICNFLLLTI